MGNQAPPRSKLARKCAIFAVLAFPVLALMGCETAPIVNKEPIFLDKTFRDCPQCPEMVVVPAGRFLMGSPHPWEQGPNDTEGPPHPVTISRQFAVGIYEVTFDEWNACVAEGDCNGYRPDDMGWGLKGRPVINVSWEDAKAYTAWLSAKTSQPYRLLTESEWEFASRAGTVTRYWWGHQIGSENANCFGCGSPWDNTQTAPVGSFLPNAFGLYDMLGNVQEWVEDCWHANYLGAPVDGRARRIQAGCRTRVVRGGSWLSPATDIRAAARAGFAAETRRGSHGFRVAKTMN